MQHHYTKYLGIVIVFLFVFLLSFSYFQKRPEVLLSPGEDASFGTRLWSNVIGFYSESSVFLSGILIVVAIALLILIVVSSKYN